MNFCFRDSISDLNLLMVSLLLEVAVEAEPAEEEDVLRTLELPGLARGLLFDEEPLEEAAFMDDPALW